MDIIILIFSGLIAGVLAPLTYKNFFGKKITFHFYYVGHQHHF